MDIKLGRLRQWAGEVISSLEKPGLNEEFRELEKDIELRKEGITRLIIASEAYHHALSKKKASEVVSEGEKLLPIDILGVVMTQHGEQFGEDSTFGNALYKLGSAHCKVATLQEAFALTFKDTFLASLEKFKDEIKEYEVVRKKLDTRRSAADSASAKFEKLQNSKKEKDRREAEDEMERAKQRYDETTEDLRAHMHAIQENEHSQHQDLTALIDLETNFVQNYLDVLKEVKADWQGRPPLKGPKPRSRSHSIQSFQEVSGTVTPRLNGKSNGRSRTDSMASYDSSDESGNAPGKKPASLKKHGRSNSNASAKSVKSIKQSSRPSSRLSRRRTDSGAASTKGSPRVGEEGKEADKDKEKDKEKRRMSVAEWASSAIGMGGSKSKKNKSDKDSFSTLDEGEVPRGSGEFGTASKLSSSFLSISKLTSMGSSSNSVNLKDGSAAPGGSSSSVSTPSTTAKILKPPSLEKRKVVRALYDFNGSSDELSFKAGTEIVVVNEVLDDWWMGETGGRSGLFPTSHTEVIGSTTVSNGSPTAPASLSKAQKSPKISNSRRGSFTGRRSSFSTPKNSIVPLPGEDIPLAAAESDADNDRFLTSDAEDDGRLNGIQPLGVNVKSPVFYGGFGDDSESFVSTDTNSVFEESDHEQTSSQQHHGLSTVVSGFGDDWVTFDGTNAIGQGSTRQILQPPPAPIAPPQKQRTTSLLGSFTNSLKIPVVDSAQQPLISRSRSDDPSLSSATSSEFGNLVASNVGPVLPSRVSPTKKVPPPPPPRRPTNNPGLTPPIPMRKVPASSSGNPTVSASLTSSRSSLLGPSINGSGSGSGSGSDIGYDRSPFESALELGLDDSGSGGGKCDKFRQNPFKPQGMCSNCLHFHD